MQTELRELLVEGLQTNLEGENPLRVKQRKVQQDMIDDLANSDNPTYGLIKRPTGTGKTANMLNAAVAMDQRTLIIVPRKYLAEQTAYDDGFLKEDYHFNVKRDDIGIYNSDQSAADKKAAVDKKYLVTTYASALRLAKEGLISPDPSSPYYRPVVMLDEVHRAKGPGVRALVEPFLDSCYVTGWTATDRFANGTNVSDIIFRGRKRIHETSVAQAVADGEISSYKNLLVNTKVAFGSKIRVPHGENFKQEDIDRIVNQAGRDEQAIQMYANYYDDDTGIGFRGKTAVCYCGGVEHAGKLAGKFNRALSGVFGKDIIPAMSISGETPKEDRQVEAGTLEKGEWVNGRWIEAGQFAEAHTRPGRDSILRDYKAGKIKVLCNADLLIEGFDAPNASLCFMLVPTGSPIVAEQTGGRVLRLDKNNPDKFAYIVNFVDEDVIGGLTFGQLAGDMQITPQEMKRQKELRGEREKPEPPLKLPPDMVQIDHLEVVSSVEQLEEMRKKMNEEGKLPLKTPEWMSMPELREALAARNRQKVFDTSDTALIKLRSQIAEAVQRDGTSIEFPLKDGVTLTASYRESEPGYQGLCFKPSEQALDQLARDYGRVKTQYTPWKSSHTLYKELANRVRIPEYTAPYNGLWDIVDDALKKGGRRLIEGTEAEVHVGNITLKTMARRAIANASAVVPSIYVDEPTLNQLAGYFLDAGVPPRNPAAPARTHGYFDAEQLVKLGYCSHRGVAELLLNTLATEADQSLPPLQPQAFDKEGKVQGAFLSTHKHAGTFRAYIPADDEATRGAWQRKFQEFETHYKARAETADAQERLAMLHKTGEFSRGGGAYLASGVSSVFPEKLRPIFGAMRARWSAMVQNPPYAIEQDLGGGIIVEVNLAESAYTQPHLRITVYKNGKSAESQHESADFLKPIVEKEWERTNAAQIKVTHDEPKGEWHDNLSLRSEVRSAFPDEFDGEEFSAMTARLRKTADGRTCTLVLPESEAKIRVRNRNAIFEIMLTEDEVEKKAQLRALHNYSYGIDESTPAPEVTEVAASSTPPPGSQPPKRCRR